MTARNSSTGTSNPLFPSAFGMIAPALFTCKTLAARKKEEIIPRHRSFRTSSSSHWLLLPAFPSSECPPQPSKIVKIETKDKLHLGCHQTSRLQNNKSSSFPEHKIMSLESTIWIPDTWRAFTFLPVIVTFAPFSANRRAVSRPIPAEEPAILK